MGSSDPYAQYADAVAAPSAAANDPYAQYATAVESTPTESQDPQWLQDAKARNSASSPVSGNSFWQNIPIGAGKLYSDIGLGAKQAYAQLTGGDPATVTDPFTGQTAAQKRTTDAPIQGTWGGKVGEFAGALPAAFIPGANTGVGATVLGGLFGATTPTVGDESRLLNTGVGAGVGLASQWAGNKLSNWLTNRAAEPFLGWNQKSGNQALATAVGSDAPKLDQPAIKETADRLGGIFSQARDPSVTVPMSTPTSQVLTNAEAGLNESSRAGFWRNPQVLDLMTHLQNGTANAQQLGQISSQLGTEAAGEMASKTGDRALGKALFAVQEHVDDLVGGSITDPALSSAYDAARPQYRTFLMARRPTILNSATGDVHLNNLGKFLQNRDFKGYAQGLNQSDLYNAARYGQASRLGSAPSPPILQPGKWATWHAINNPLVGATAGTISRLGAPIAPVLPQGLLGAGLTAPTLWRQPQ